MNYRLLAVVVALGVVLSLMVPIGPHGWKALGVDYDVFWEAAARPTAVLYPGDPNQPFVNPPTSMLLFKPLALFDRTTGFVVWAVASLAAYFFIFARLFPRYVATAALVSPLVLWAMWLGQSTVLLSAMIGAGIAFSPVLGGALLGLALVIKPQIVWLAPLVFLVRRDWPRLASMASAAVAAAALTALVFGTEIWLGWFEAIPTFRAAVADRGILAGTIAFASQAHAFGPLAAGAFFAAAIVLAGLAIARLARDADTATLLLLVVGCSAVAAPYSLPHDLLALVPVAVVRIVEGRTTIERVLASAFYCGLLLPVVLLLAIGKKLLGGRASLFASSHAV